VHLSKEDKSGRFTWGNKVVAVQTSQTIVVPSVTLASVIHRPIDFLKMDIEGAELQVLSAAEKKLHFIQEMVIEVHETNHKKPTLVQSALKELLERNGFTVKIYHSLVLSLNKLLSPFSPKVVMPLCMIRAVKRN
jgi:acetyl-CoA carboxylase alpha subunit